MSATLLTVIAAALITLNMASRVPAAATKCIRALIPLVRALRDLRSEIHGGLDTPPEKVIRAPKKAPTIDRVRRSPR